MTIRSTDRGLDRFVAAARALDGTRVTVGVHADTGAQEHPSGGDIASAALVLEVGSDTRRPRPWLRSAVDERAATLGVALAEAGVGTLAGQPLTTALAAPAAELVDAMQARVPVATGAVRDAIEARVNGVRVS